jgi:hypothetical protein
MNPFLLEVLVTTQALIILGLLQRFVFTGE